MKQQQHCRIVILLTCITAFLLCIASGSAIATEVYTWTDADGNVHFGDKPPSGQKAETVSIRAAPPASNAVIDDNASGQNSSASPSAAEVKRQEIVDNRQQHRDQQAQTDRMCAIHARRLEKMEPNRRVYYQDADGETSLIDDDRRVALIEESKAFIANNCK